jgi:hypothetical protein
MIEMNTVLPALGENFVLRGGLYVTVRTRRSHVFPHIGSLVSRQRDRNIWRLNCMWFINENNLLGLT